MSTTVSRWSFRRVLFFIALCSISTLACADLTLDVPARRTWKDTLRSLSYTPTDTSETPIDSMSALESLPSLNVKKFGGVAQVSTVSFRGQTSRNTHVRIDDIPIQDTTGNVNFSPLFGGGTRLEKVLPGSQGVLYGSGASGGVVLMETPFLPSDTLFTAQGGSFQSAYSHMAHQKLTPNTRWAIHGEAARTAGLPHYGKARKLGEKGRGHLANVATRLEHQIDKSNTFNLTARILENDSRFDTYDTYSHLLSKPQGTLASSLSLLGAGWTTSTKDSTHTLKGFLSHHKLKTTSSPSSIILMSGANYTGIYNFYPETESSFLLGFQENRMDCDHLLKKVMFSLYGAWIQKTSLTQNLSAEVGARLDADQKFGVHTVYSGMIAYSYHDTLLKGGIRTGFLNPNLYSLYVTNDFVQSNPSLKPEQTQTLDFTIEQKMPSHTIGFQITPFWTRIQKMIHALYQQGRYQSINMPGITKLSGIETQLSYFPSSRSRITANYTYTYLNSNQPGNNPEFPKHKAYFQLDYNVTESCQISPELFYIGTRHSYQGEVLKPYSLLNVVFKYEVKPGANIFGRIDNLFDTRYVQTYNYQTPGRSLYVGTTLYF